MLTKKRTNNLNNSFRVSQLLERFGFLANRMKDIKNGQKEMKLDW